MIPAGRLDPVTYDYQHPLELLDAVSAVRPQQDGAVFTMSTMRYTRELLERYGTFVEIGSEAGAGSQAFLKVSMVQDSHTVRIQMSRNQQMFDAVTPMMIAPPRAVPSVTCATTESTGETRISAGDVTVLVQHKPFSITILSDEGHEIWSSLPTSVFQHAPTGMTDINGASISDGWPWFFRRMLPFGFVESADGAVYTVTTARLHHDEHLYGFGESYRDIDHRGSRVDIWQTNATGNTWPESYKNIPFFMSSRGYGLFLNSARAATFHLGDLSRTRYSIQNAGSVLDLFVFCGPRFADILPRYCALTGAPAMPPLWSFGIWMSRMSYNAQDQVQTVAQELRDRQIPCDVIHIDTDWFERPWINDLTFSTERFPDPRAMIAFLRDRGMRLSLWQIPYIGLKSTFYAEGMANGYFATDEDGEPWHLNGFFGPAAIVDYSNPEAVSWMQSKLDALFELGVSVIKTDFGEGAPPEARYHSIDGNDMHNLYPLLYNKAFYEHTRATTGEGIVWARSAFAGSQRYPVHWGGDPAALWDDLGNLWHGGLSLALSGIPFWSIDIGGFGGTPTPELYIRWIQVGMFVSHPRAHGPIAREPWVFGPEAERVFRAYGSLRYQLLPYIWNEAHVATRTMSPFHQPLLYQWQDDPTTATIDDEYLLGREILVSPVLDMSEERRVYLPEGKWVDMWRDTIVDGARWITVHAPLTHLPLFVRSGAIIPFINPTLSTDEADFSTIHLHLYPHDTRESEISLPELGTLIVSLNVERGTVTLTATEADITVIPHIHGSTTHRTYDYATMELAPGEVADAVTVKTGTTVVVPIHTGFIPE